MDIQLQELIETIKNEGIAEADRQAAEIVAEAEKRAAGIVEKAEAEAGRLTAEAKREISRSEQASRDALAQAGRDLMLNLRGRILQLFDAVLAGAVEEGLRQKGLEDSITALVRAWAEKGSGDMTILLPEADRDRIEKTLQARLGAELRRGVVLRPVAGIEAGFRIAEKDGAAYYDFTARGLAEMLSEYLNPRLAEILEKAVQAGA